jgi:hypothetical protein
MVAQRLGKREITDNCAATIASWWQSSGTVGSVLATLAGGLETDVVDLLNDIHLTRQDVTQRRDKDALDMLATWALYGGED